MSVCMGCLRRCASRLVNVGMMGVVDLVARVVKQCGFSLYN